MEGEADAGGLPEGITYHGAIRPLIENHCLGCHSEGGPAPFSLERWSEVQPRAYRLVDAVSTGRMPPAQTNPDCRTFVGQRWLSPSDRDVFVQWAADGYQEGLPEQYETPAVVSEPAPVDLGPPDIVAPLATPYTPNLGADGEDYAFVELDHVFAEETHVVASRIEPGLPDMLHHATVHLTDEDGRMLVDDGDPEVSGFQAMIAGYAPGIQDLTLPEGAAFVVPAGAHLRIDLHYHARDSQDGEPTPTDEGTEVRLWLMDEGESPVERADMEARWNAELDIEADDPESVQTAEVWLTDEPMRIAYVAPHMHYRGVAARMEVLRTDGTRECLLDTPNYDFDWQLLHRLPPGDEVSLLGGEKLALTCVYDNSQENQPYFDGTQVRTTDLTFGPSSLDEMCTAVVVALYPLAP